MTRRAFVGGAGAIGTMWLTGCGVGSAPSVSPTRSRNPRIRAAGDGASTIYWVDEFLRPDGAVGNGWVAESGATAQIVSNVLRRTDQGNYRILSNPAGGALPANYIVSLMVPNSLVTSSGVYWGLLARYANGAGIKVMWQNEGPRALGAGHAGYNNDIAITVTGGYPASWAQNQNHMVSLGFAGSTVTIYLDGLEYGHFTDATNAQAGTAIAVVGDAGGTPLFNVLSVAVTDTLPTMQLPASMTASANAAVVIGSSGNTISLTGTNTQWVAGSPGTPLFTVSGGTITSQVVQSATSATIVLTAPAAPGLVTITDTVSGITTDIFVQGRTVYWVDDFSRADGAPGNGWTAQNQATAAIVGQVLRRTDQGDYRILYNPAGGNLPADYFVTMTIPHSLVTSSGVYWGLLARYANGAGIKVMWQNGGPQALGAGHAGYFNDIAITVTGGYPASWAQNRDHLVSLQFAGDSVTIYLDQVEYGYFTEGTNNQAATGIAIVGDAGGTELFNVLNVQVTDYLPGLAPRELAATVSTTGGTSTSIALHAAATGGAGNYTFQWHRSDTTGFTPSPATAIPGATTQDFTDTGLTLGILHYYRVVVTDGAAATATSAELGAAPQAAPLTVGYLANNSIGTASVALSCAGTTGGAGTVHYQWHRAVTFTQSPVWDGPSAIANSDSLAITDSPPQAGLVYSYVMLARDSAGTVVASGPLLSLRYLSQLRLGVLADICFAQHLDPLGRRVPDWLGLYLQSAWGPRDVQIVDQSTGNGSSVYWAPDSGPYTAAVAAFRAAGVTHVFLQYCYDGNHAATDATVLQLVQDGFIVLVGQHMYTTQSVGDQWAWLADGIHDEEAAIRAIANGTTIRTCDLVSPLSGVAFGRHSTDPNVPNAANSYVDGADLHPSAHGIPMLAFGIAAGIARGLGWTRPGQ